MCWQAALLAPALMHGTSCARTGTGECWPALTGLPTPQFCPQYTGAVELPLVLHFTAPGRPGLVLLPLRLSLYGVGLPPPVAAVQPTLDFGVVVPGRNYCAALVLTNSGSAAAR